MEKVKSIVLPRLNKGELVIVNSKDFSKLIDNINDIIESANNTITQLSANIEYLQNENLQLHEKYNMLQNTCDKMYKNISFLATAIKQGGFLNE